MQDPMITNIERWGYPEPRQDPICPCCNDECGQFFLISREIIGCEHCIDTVDAYSYYEDKGMEVDIAICPCCGEECEEFFIQGKVIMGCDNCIDTVDAWEYDDNIRRYG